MLKYIHRLNIYTLEKPHAVRLDDDDSLVCDVAELNRLRVVFRESLVSIVVFNSNVKVPFHSEVFIKWNPSFLYHELLIHFE